jgi:hypothetical protein
VLLLFHAAAAAAAAQDPNSLVLYMPGDMSVRTRVMRRSEQQTGDDRLETSEFMQQVFDSGDPGIIGPKT